jgi:hypothetical protein
VTTFWDVMNRLASVLGVLTAVGAVAIGVLRWKNILGPHTSAPELIAGSVILIIAGIGCVVGGVVMRQNVFSGFSHNRGRTSTIVLLVGIALLIIGLIGLVVV